MSRVLGLLLLLGAGTGCGTMVRASAGPTVSTRGHVGAEVAVEAGTHWIALWPSNAPLAVRAQVSMLDGDPVALVGLSAGVSVNPEFYGAGPPREDKRVHGGAGYLSGAIGRNTDDTTGVRVGVGVGTGRGDHVAPTRDRYVAWGGELAWQDDLGQEMGSAISARQRFTASVFVMRWAVPPGDLDLGDPFPMTNK